MGIRIAIGTVDIVEVGIGTNSPEDVRYIVDAYRSKPASGGNHTLLIVHYPETLSNGAKTALIKALENLRDGDAPYLHVVLVCADPRSLPAPLAKLVER